jgi:DNA topoisomerase-1
MANKKERTLVIVESPAKSKTIKKILGDSYQIEASYGHIRNLPTKDPSTDNLGFDVNNNFEPKFEIIPNKKDVVKKLNDLSKKFDTILIASDPDREGEAIAWHVRQILTVPDEKIKRIEFNEITPKAVKYSVEHPRTINMDMVQAQQTRQILDKLVGYKLSPVLWKQMGNYNLSAGRVQSVALRMICERENEIEAFVPQEYWSIHIELAKDGKVFEAELSKYKNKSIEKTIKNEEAATKIVEELKNSDFNVAKVTNKTTKRKPTAPFITSTLQRAASSKLGFGVSKTMQVAQKLYEGIELDSGAVGLITYMRTDSVRVSDDAMNMAKDFILNNYGEKYYPEKPNVYIKGKQNVQDAHEAIRPSYPDKTPESIKQYLDNDQYRLYKLIWEKFMSSQMENAEIANKTIEISAGDYTLKAGTSKITFDGFLKLYNDSEEENEAEKEAKIPDLEKGDKVDCKKINPKQHFTSPPPRYNEASLVKALEEHGIGRPSTYATIITVIQTRKYVEKKDKALHPTILGRAVSKQLVEQFADIMDYKFTAGLEEKLDLIAEKKAVWNKVIKEFYDPFMEEVHAVMKTAHKINIETDIKCPKCGKTMFVKTGRNGSQFLGCSGYPDCKTIMSINVLSEADANTQEEQQNEIAEEKCDKCGSDMIFKTGPYGKYLECTNQECKHRKPYHKSTGVTCPKCGKGEIVFKKSKRGNVFFGCNKYPECDYVSWYEPVKEECPECHSFLVKKFTKKEKKLVCSNSSCHYSKVVEEEENV